MLSLTVSRNSGQPLADQIVAGIKRQIDDRHLRPGTKLPSIRNFAESYKVSRFTVVQAYDRLVAMGCLQSRRGAGFYTAAAPTPAEATHAQSDTHKRNEELVWLIRRSLEPDENVLLAGGPWLPNSWLDEAGIRQNLNVLARKNGAYLTEYGHPFGYLPLREHLALMLAGLGITAGPGQILLTHGTSQALELVIRYLLRPGDAALVDDPGYYNMFGNLRLQGVEMLAVPRNPDGPDVVVLEKLATVHRPKVYFTQSVMQNPTGTDMSPHVAFKVLQAAERHNFTVVEDDIFCDLQMKTTPRSSPLGGAVRRRQGKSDAFGRSGFGLSLTSEATVAASYPGVAFRPMADGDYLSTGRTDPRPGLGRCRPYCLPAFSSPPSTAPTRAPPARPGIHPCFSLGLWLPWLSQTFPRA